MPDFHPDQYYESYSSTEQASACHRGDGPAGVFGAETTDCDSPISLINATFQWIDDNVRDTVDFVIWTGDSVRHDSDEEIPRTEKEVVQLNELLVQKFTQVFGKEDNINDTDPTNDFTIPIVPSFGNNDIMPHNIFAPGPSEWTKKYSHIWRKFIPEEQRHGFERGGWFSVEVIPNRLAVFSLNTLYFFKSNTAVDGCAGRSEPGYEQMEWLRIQLQFLRQRGMKAILMGHVPPARTESKQGWDETCWQKYTLWMRQYRDVVVGSVYGHMNIDHFMLQDFEDISKKALKCNAPAVSRMALDDELTIESSADYLTELRYDWSRIPDPPKSKSRSLSSLGYIYDLFDSLPLLKRKHKKSKEDKFLDKIGGEWAERYSLSLVSPSIVPNYFPTMRVVEYNISGLDVAFEASTTHDRENHDLGHCTQVEREEGNFDASKSKKKKGRRKKQHKPKKPDFVMPKPPSKSAPPGPAYSPQTFSWLGYTQYYANLTHINGDFTQDRHDDVVEEEGWNDGKYSGKKPKERAKKHHKKFEYQVEYDTRSDSVFGLEDLTVKNYLKLAGRIGQYKPAEGDRLKDGDTDEATEEDAESQPSALCHENNATAWKNKKYKKHHGRKHKHKHRKAINKIWFTFVNRAYVGTRDDEELHDEFGQ